MTKENHIGNGRAAALHRPIRTLRGVQVLGTGSYVPDSIVSTDHLAHRLGCNAKSLLRLTGIRERRHAAPQQATSDLACEAARRTLEQANVDPADVDLLILATVTPDMTVPSVACLVQDRLGLTCPAFDLGAACAGFMYALVQGAAAIAAHMAERVLVVGADCMSRIVNPDDIKTFPLFGDGAGAVLLGKGSREQGLLGYCLGSEGAGAELLSRRGCGSRLPPSAEVLQSGEQFLQMDGSAVFTWAVTMLCDTVQDVLRATGLTPGEVDLYVPHQANIRIINAALDVIGIPRGLVYTNLDRYGNTSAGSVPLALDEAARDDRVRRGDKVVLSGFGAGLVWGTAIWAW